MWQILPLRILALQICDISVINYKSWWWTAKLSSDDKFICFWPLSLPGVVLGVSLHMPERFLMVTTNQSVREVLLSSVFVPDRPCQRSEEARNLGPGNGVIPPQESLWKQVVRFKSWSGWAMVNLWRVMDSPGEASMRQGKMASRGLPSASSQRSLAAAYVAFSCFHVSAWPFSSLLNVMVSQGDKTWELTHCSYLWGENWEPQPFQIPFFLSPICRSAHQLQVHLVEYDGCFIFRGVEEQERWLTIEWSQVFALSLQENRIFNNALWSLCHLSREMTCVFCHWWDSVKINLLLTLCTSFDLMPHLKSVCSHFGSQLHPPANSLFVARKFCTPRSIAGYCYV